MSVTKRNPWTTPMQGRDPLARAVRDLSTCPHGGDGDGRLLTALCAHVSEVVSAASCGVVLADDQQQLGDIFASDAAARTLVQLQVKCAQGPCVDAFRSRKVVMVDDLTQQGERWPALAQCAERHRVRRIMAVPMRAGEQIIGALQVICSARGTFTESDVLAVEALTDMVADTIVHERAMGDTLATVDQLQHALHSRVVIEQAKGVLAERTGLSLSAAFEQLRRYARNNHRRLHDVCEDLITGRLELDDLHPARK